MADEITPKEEVKIESQIEVVSDPESVIAEAPKTQTAQIPVNEPLAVPTEIETEPITETIQEETKIVEPEIKPEPIQESIPEIVTEEVKPEISEPVYEPVETESKPAEQIPEVKVEPKEEEVKPKQKQESNPEPKQPKVIPVIIPSKSLARELLVKARNMIQFRKRKKFDKIMTLFAKQTKLTNDEVEKFMHVSDATATRYLNTLEKENKIKQNGKTGKSVFYSKI